MNSEELELSLRTEFENYLKDVFAGMRQDVSAFQKNFEAEFEKHRSQMDEAFRQISARFESDPKFDKVFTESVVEHLRLARDDGAKLTAEAMSRAERLDRPADAANYDELRDAINDITGQTTQSAILKSLVDHAARFTPRGAFFIVKNEAFVCWRRFDANGVTDDDNVRKIHFPLSADTLLADAVNSLATRDSETADHLEDFEYLNALGFSRPDRMYAVPLTARGRGVAVLYADRGESGEAVNVEAIESLVRVAGLTVELRAAAASAVAPAPAVEAAQPAAVEKEVPAEPVAEERLITEDAPEAVESKEDSVSEEPTTDVTYEDDSYASEDAATQEYTGEVSVDTEAEVTEEYSAPVAAEAVNDFEFAAAEDSSEVESVPVEEYSYASEPVNGNGHAHEAAPEPAAEVASPQPVKSRLSDRNVDLPIEVADDERRFHNDARRFARLLVSEIKLYNEQKVHDGRDAGDLYDRLREAIERSREMYEKRVKPQVASKFDYFHYELVNNLAEGHAAKLGSGYPGASV